MSQAWQVSAEDIEEVLSKHKEVTDPAIMADVLEGAFQRTPAWSARVAKAALMGYDMLQQAQYAAAEIEAILVEADLITALSS